VIRPGLAHKADGPIVRVVSAYRSSLNQLSPEETRPCDDDGDDGGDDELWRQMREQRKPIPEAQQQIAFSWPECSMTATVETLLHLS
jgi:hypothetical protein